MFLQLQRAGIPIDPWTLAELFDVPNFGKPPDGANNVIERWESWQRILAQIQMSIQMQQQLQMAQMGLMGLGIPGQGPGGAEDPMQPKVGESQQGPGGGNQRGRPPTGQEAPHLEQKDQGTRTTISES